MLILIIIIVARLNKRMASAESEVEFLKKELSLVKEHALPRDTNNNDSSKNIIIDSISTTTTTTTTATASTISNSQTPAEAQAEVVSTDECGYGLYGVICYSSDVQEEVPASNPTQLETTALYNTIPGVCRRGTAQPHQRRKEWKQNRQRSNLSKR